MKYVSLPTVLNLDRNINIYYGYNNKPFHAHKVFSMPALLLNDCIQSENHKRVYQYLNFLIILNYTKLYFLI